MKNLFAKIGFKNPVEVVSVTFLGLILIILPSFSPFFDIPYDSKRFFEVCFFVLIGVLIVFSSKKASDIINTFLFFPRPVRIGLVSVLILGVVSAAVSSYPMVAFLEVSFLFLLFIFILVSAYYCRRDGQKFEKLFLGTIVAFFVLYFVMMAAGYVQGFMIEGFPLWPSTGFVNIIIDGKKMYPDPFLGFVNVRFFNQVQTWTLPFFVLLFLRIPKEYWAYRIVSFLALSFYWVLVFASDARGTLISSVIAFLFVAMLFRGKIKEYLKIYIGGMAIGGACYFLFFKLIRGGGRNLFGRPGDRGRSGLWEQAFELISEYPFLGAGPMHYADFKNGFTNAHPHNSLFQFASEWGLVVAAILLSVVVFALWKFINQTRTMVNEETGGIQKKVLPVVLLSSLTAGIVHSSLSGLIVMPLSQLYMALVIGWSIGYYQSKADSGEKRQNEAYWIWPLVTRGVIVLASVIVLYAGMKSLKTLDEDRAVYMKRAETNVIYPRFWDQGFIGLDE